MALLTVFQILFLFWFVQYVVAAVESFALPRRMRFSIFAKRSNQCLCFADKISSVIHWFRKKHFFLLLRGACLSIRFDNTWCLCWVLISVTYLDESKDLSLDDKPLEWVWSKISHCSGLRSLNFRPCRMLGNSIPACGSAALFSAWQIRVRDRLVGSESG